jgi:hypothetical protein
MKNRLQLLLQQMQAIGHFPTSVASRQTIDTSKAVGGQYTFYSFLKSPRSEILVTPDK